MWQQLEATASAFQRDEASVGNSKRLTPHLPGRASKLPSLTALDLRCEGDSALQHKIIAVA